MGRQVNWDEVPDSGATLVNQGMYEAVIESIEEGQSKAGKLMYTTIFRIAGGAYDGTPLYERFSVGTDDDPNADEPTTWKSSIGASRMKAMFKAVHVANTGDVDEMCTAATGQHLQLTVDIEVDSGAKNPQYKGVKRNRIVRMYPMGEREAPATPAPSSQLAKAVAAAPAKATGTKKGTAAVPTVKCGVCKQDIARADYSQHVLTHGDEE